MTTAPDTITLTVGAMAALIVRCAIQLASLSIQQANRDAKGWTAQERAEVVAHAEKATPCAQDGQQPAFESEAIPGRDLSRRNPNYGRVNGDVEDIVYGVKPKRGRPQASIIHSQGPSTPEVSKIEPASLGTGKRTRKEVPHATE